MDLAQVKKLKLNARNIQSTLISYNKSLKKIRLDEISFTRRQELNQKRAEKEENIEKPSKVSQAIETLKSKLVATPMSIFDKIKEFFGLVLMGLLINNLPRIIKGLQKFFGDNPWIMSGLKEVIKFVGDGLSKLIQVVGLISNATYEKTKRERNQIEVLINSLDSMFTSIENGLLGMISRAAMPQPMPTVNSPNYSAFKAGGGKAAVQQGKSVQQVVKQGQQNITRYNSGPRAPTPAPALPSPLAPPSIPIQSFAKGGTVKDTTPGRKSTIRSNSRRTFARPGGTAKGRKAIQSTQSFNQFRANTILDADRIQTQDENNNLFEQLIKKFRELKSLKGDKDGEKIVPGGGGGIPPGGEVVQSESSDFWLLSLISLYENSNLQGAADVAQSIYNRMSNRGQTARQVILAENQYQPVRKFGGYAAWGQVVDRETAVAHIKKYPGNSASVKGLDAVAKALIDPTKQAAAAKFVGVRPDFRNEGYESSNDEMTDDKSRFNHTFGFNRGGSRGKITKPASVPTFVEGDVITEYTPTTLKGKNTAFQGSTGRSTGPHIHIGPMELLDSKTLAYVGNQSNQGLLDSRKAAFRVIKALIARKTKFVLSNLDVNKVYDPARERLTDKQVQNLILAEQNAHMSRSMGSSWGGIDIVALGVTDIPIPVGKVVYHPDGFGYRAQLLGTKGFVGHLTKGSKATPTSQIEKTKYEPKIEPTIRQQDLDKLKTVINSKPGSGEQVKIPGVGTYIRGKNIVGMAEDKYFDENGDKITKDEFYKKLEKIKGESNQISSLATPFDVKQIKRGNLKPTDDEEGSSTVMIAQQQIIVPGPPVPVPYPVQQKSNTYSTANAYSMEALSARSLV